MAGVSVAAVTVPGLLIYQFSSNIVFYNAEHFKQRVRTVIAESDHHVEWVVLDFSAVSHTDVTGIQHIDELGAGDLYPTIRSALPAFHKAKRKARSAGPISAFADR